MDEHKKSLRRSWRSASPVTKLPVVFTGIIALATVLYCIFSGWQLYEIHKSSDDTHALAVAATEATRPYLGVNAISITHSAVENGRSVNGSMNPRSDTSMFGFSVEVKNFGPIPSRHSEIRWSVVFGGIEQPAPKVPDHPSNMYPGELTYLVGHIGTDGYQALMHETKILEFQVMISYEWPGGSDRECQKERYSPSINRFLNLGACSSQSN